METNVHTAFAEFFDKDYLKPFLYLLSKKMTEGNVCLDLNKTEKADEITVNNTLDADQIAKHPLVGAAGSIQPFILNEEKLYLQRYFNYETKFIHNILRLIHNENGAATQQGIIAHKTFIQSLFPQEQIGTNWQLQATLSALLHSFHVITGGPGTGKTTSVSKLLCVLMQQHKNLKVLLAAPTGKAAVRMTESLSNTGVGLEQANIKVDDAVIKKIASLAATTIHTLLGYKNGSIYFQHNAQNPLSADVIIIDECSMIDIALFSKLLEAIGDHTKLILLGDSNQLSSVEAGSVFGDLCYALKYVSTEELLLAETESFMGLPQKFTPYITELQTSHRFSDEGGIGKFSKAIINNEVPDLISFFENKDEQISILEQYGNEEVEQFSEKFREYIEEADIVKALHKINNCKILCAIKFGDYGVYKMNQLVENHLSKKGWINPISDFYENKLVMVTQNAAALGLNNGDTGIIRNYEGKPRACFLNAEGTLKHFSPAVISNLDTAFAITIHKSQGSEFDEVMITLPNVADHTLLTRELVYTAVTRAKRKAILLCDQATLLQTVLKSVDRVSGISDRLQTKLL